MRTSPGPSGSPSNRQEQPELSRMVQVGLLNGRRTRVSSGGEPWGMSPVDSGRGEIRTVEHGSIVLRRSALRNSWRFCAGCGLS